jgi:hypothetical protein
MTLANRYGYVTSLINPTSNRHCTSTFTASIFSSDILRSLCFLSFAFGLICVDYFSVDPYQVKGGPSKNITILVQEL